VVVPCKLVEVDPVAAGWEEVQYPTLAAVDLAQIALHLQEVDVPFIQPQEESLLPAPPAALEAAQLLLGKEYQLPITLQEEEEEEEEALISVMEGEAVPTAEEGGAGAVEVVQALEAETARALYTETPAVGGM
jgi:hypothetical protein